MRRPPKPPKIDPSAANATQANATTAAQQQEQPQPQEQQEQRHHQQQQTGDAQAAEPVEDLEKASVEEEKKVVT